MKESVSYSVGSDSVIPWTVAHQAPLSMEISRQEYWSGLTFPTPGDLPNHGLNPQLLHCQVDSLPLVPPGKPSQKKVLVAQSCLTLCNPMDCSLLGSSVRGIFQARILEWVDISYSRGFSRPRDQTCISFIFCIGKWILYHCITWEVP